MSVYDSDLNLIGSVQPDPGYMALGRTTYNRFANMTVSRLPSLTANTANLLQRAGVSAAPAAPLVAPTQKVAAAGPAVSSGGVPTPVLVGAGVVGLLALGLVAFKIHKKHGG